MNKMHDVTLHLLCGKMAAGKSTLARSLAEQDRAILLVEDDWLAQLYPDEITDIPSYIKYAARLNKPLFDHVLTILGRGVSVVLDFPANTKNQRNYLRPLFERADVPHVLHFVDVSDELCKQQLRKRNIDNPEKKAFTSDAEFDAITAYFQAPTDNERFNILRYRR